MIMIITFIMFLSVRFLNENLFIYQGHPRLVTAIANLYSKLLNIGHQIDPNKEVLVTDGAYEALFTGFIGMI